MKYLTYIFRTGSLRVSNVADILKNVSANKSLILGGQVINVTKITFLARTLVKGTPEDLFGQKWTGGQFLLVDLQGNDPKKERLDIS